MFTTDFSFITSEETDTVTAYRCRIRTGAFSSLSIHFNLMRLCPFKPLVLFVRSQATRTPP